MLEPCLADAFIAGIIRACRRRVRGTLTSAFNRSKIPRKTRIHACQMALAGSLTSVNRSFQVCRLTLLRMLAVGHQSYRLRLVLFNAGSFLRHTLNSNYLTVRGLRIIEAVNWSWPKFSSNQFLVQFKEVNEFLLWRALRWLLLRDWGRGLSVESILLALTDSWLHLIYIRVLKLPI